MPRERDAKACWRGHLLRNRWGRCLICHKYMQRMKRRGLPTVKRPMFHLDREALRNKIKRMPLEVIAARAAVPPATLGHWYWRKSATANRDALNRVHLVIGAKEV